MGQISSMAYKLIYSIQLIKLASLIKKLCYKKLRQLKSTIFLNWIIPRIKVSPKVGSGHLLE